VRKLESLDAWRVPQELAYQAYVLTLEQGLAKHFALIDQVRRASLSVPANIAEGYALGTRLQFLRCLKLALGSTVELKSHLAVLRRLPIRLDSDVNAVITLSDRVARMIIGLIRSLGCRPR